MEVKTIAWRPAVYLDPGYVWERWDGDKWVVQAQSGLIYLDNPTTQFRAIRGGR